MELLVADRVEARRAALYIVKALWIDDGSPVQRGECDEMEHVKFISMTLVIISFPMEHLS
jgi:hypothetical protein